MLKTAAFPAEKLAVPTVTLVVMLCEVMRGTLAKSPKFAIAPAAFETPVTLHLGLPLELHC
jgi:hypothetical protein